METGTADTEGGLTREQVNRVVRAHAAAIRYCYEKELQRQPSLSGKVELYWVIRPNGTVDRIKVAGSDAGQPGGRGLHGAAGAELAVPALGQRDHRAELPFFFKGGG